MQVCIGFHCKLQQSGRFEKKKMSIARESNLAYENVREGCLSEQLPRPGSVVMGPRGVAIEPTRLNVGEEASCGLLTSPACMEKWDMDSLGRPLNLPTRVYIQRGYKVGHGNVGMLSDKTPAPKKKCASLVPKTIHYIWVGSRSLGLKYLKNLANSAVLNPRHKVILWLDRAAHKKEIDLLDLFKNITDRPAGAVVFGMVQDEAKRMRNWDIIHRLNSSSKPNTIGAALSDILRLELLYLHGGVYLDIDIRIFSGFDEYGSLFWWPWVTHKVCGVNIPNNAFGFDGLSGYLDFALDAFREGCSVYSRCLPYAGAGPPFMAMTILRYNSSDISFLGQQYFSASDSAAISVGGHYNDKTWFPQADLDR